MVQIQDIQELKIWKTYCKVYENRISFELPEDSDVEEVEIIIIPRKKVSGKNLDREDWKKDFLAISQWEISADEFKKEL